MVPLDSVLVWRYHLFRAHVYYLVGMFVSLYSGGRGGELKAYCEY